MHDPKHHDEVDPSAKATTPPEPAPAKPGGFGQSAPDSTQRLPRAEDGTRLLRPGER